PVKCERPRSFAVSPLCFGKSSFARIIRICKNKRAIHRREIFTPFSRCHEKRKWLKIARLRPIVIGFSRISKKLFVCRLSRVPTLSHACPTHLVGHRSD